MSTQAATQLLQELSQDPAFESLMRQSDSVEARVAAIVQAGKKRGFEVSSTDILSAASPAAAHDGELEDEDLHGLSGGANEKWYQVIVRWLTPRNWDS